MVIHDFSTNTCFAETQEDSKLYRNSQNEHVYQKTEFIVSVTLKKILYLPHPFVLEKPRRRML